MQSYHQAVARQLAAITDNQMEITDIYSLLDWLHNIYDRYTHLSVTCEPCRSPAAPAEAQLVCCCRDVLGTVCITSPFNRSLLSPLLPPETVDRLELDCLNSVRVRHTHTHVSCRILKWVFTGS